VKISKLTNGLLVSLLLSVSVVEAENKYPATDFQPKVVYQDTDYKHSGSSSASSSSNKKSTGEVSVADSNYPAANFQPEVLYQDKGYKHSKGNVGNAASTEYASGSSEQSTEGQAEESSSLNLTIGLAILAFAGFIFYSKSTKKAKPAKRRTVAASKPVVEASGDAVSGVAKYLESKVGTKPSGVAKYLEDRDSSPVSGVAKYVAKQKVSARLASVTGVEKYLKDRS
jgi:hypothetical protein